MRPSVPDVHITEAFDADLAAYRPFAWQAAVGLIFGLLSPLAMLATILWAMPLAGLVFSYWALRRIRRFAPAMAGKKMAWIGLALSLFFTSTASADLLAYRWMIRNEARPFADLFFGFLTQGEPQKAYQLSLNPNERLSPTARLWKIYREDEKARKGLIGFTALPAVRTLLALGPRAQIRFYDFGKQIQEDDMDLVNLYYAVTYDDSGERKSFFLKVSMLRTKLAENKAGWRILNLEGGVNPDNP